MIFLNHEYLMLGGLCVCVCVWGGGGGGGMVWEGGGD